MTEKDLPPLKLQAAQKHLEYYISILIKSEENVLYYQEKIHNLKKKKDLSEDERKQLEEEYEADKRAYEDDVEKAQIHVNALSILINRYTD